MTILAGWLELTLRRQIGVVKARCSGHRHLLAFLLFTFEITLTTHIYERTKYPNRA